MVRVLLANDPCASTDPVGLQRFYDQIQEHNQFHQAGLSPWQNKYPSVQAAIYAIARPAMHLSHTHHNHEFGGYIVHNANGTYTPTKPIDIVPYGNWAPAHRPSSVADYHTHPNNPMDTSDTGDQGYANVNNVEVYAINEFHNIWLNHPRHGKPVLDDNGTVVFENTNITKWPAEKLHDKWR